MSMENINGELLATLKKRSAKFDVASHAIILGYVGSLAHGTYVPNKDPNSIDDKDVMGIIVPPKDYFYGLKFYDPKQYFDGVWDVTLYELRKFMRLLLKANPNVISLLWLEDQDYIARNEWGQRLIDNRDLFSSKAMYESFCGYARSQLKKMTHQAYEGYMGEKRKRLVDKHGYDTKNASHLIRLLRMGMEFLVEGVLHVKRHDSAELLQIKRGEYTLDRIHQMSDELFGRIEDAYIHSKLPNQPDWDAANKLCADIAEEFVGDRAAA